MEEKEHLSWSAHFASLQTTVLSPTVVTSLLPLNKENVQSKAMIQHYMTLVKDAIAYINPGPDTDHWNGPAPLRSRKTDPMGESRRLWGE